MTCPVPGHRVTTPYGLRGSYWSCYVAASTSAFSSFVDVIFEASL